MFCPKSQAMGLGYTPPAYAVEYDWNKKEISADVESRTWFELLGSSSPEVEDFMRIPPESPLHRLIVPAVEAVCSTQTLVDMNLGMVMTRDEPIAWVDDRSRTGEHREAGGWVSQAALHAALSEKRLRAGEASTRILPDADRRLLYIPNPDFRTLGPLILKASTQQSLVLGPFLWNYLKATSSIRVSFSEDNRSFSLEFHMPYYVLTTENHMRCDERLKSDGSPLRKTVSLSFMAKPRTGEKDDDPLDCLHEAHWSCMVAGYNSDVWNGYGFTDAYFYDDESQYDRSTARYFKEEWASHDPISIMDASIPVMDPREYFLNALHAQSKHIKDEWVCTVDCLKKQLEYSDRDSDSSLNGDILPLGAAEDRSRALQKLESSMKKASRLLTEVYSKLFRLTKSWDNFKAKDLRYFHALQERGPRPGQTIHAIDAIFMELQSLQAELEDLKSKHNDSLIAFELYLQVENRKTIVLQQYNINLIQIVTSPALSSAMMQSGALPWQSGFLPWLAITIVLWALTVAIRPTMTWCHRRMTLKPKMDFIDRPYEDSLRGTRLRHLGWAPEGLPFPLPTFARRQGGNQFHSL